MLEKIGDILSRIFMIFALIVSIGGLIFLTPIGGILNIVLTLLLIVISGYLAFYGLEAFFEFRDWKKKKHLSNALLMIGSALGLFFTALIVYSVLPSPPSSGGCTIEVVRSGPVRDC